MKCSLKVHNRIFNPSQSLTSPLQFSTGQLGIELTRIRLGLSKLHYHLFTYNITDNPFCSSCGIDFETPEHYFSLCNAYTEIRQNLKIKIKYILKILPPDLNNELLINNPKLFTNLLLNGIVITNQLRSLSSVEINMLNNFNNQLCTFVIDYMYHSVRFTKSVDM